MDDSEFSFKFPDLELGECCNEGSRESIERINEYLDGDIEDQLLLLKKLREFESRLDAML